MFKKIAVVTLCAFINSTAVLPVVQAYSAQSVTVPKKEALDYNQQSDILIDPATGLPYGARGEYYPAETNPLLGKSIFMTSLECAQKYGIDFCACGTLQDGTNYCYYNRPSEGFYASKEECEAVWGAGMCICPEGQTCRLYEADESANELICMGEIVFFTGEKMECRKAGVMSAGEDCCIEREPDSEACSFENTAKEVGMDDVAMLAMSLGTSLASMAGYDPKQFIAQQLGKQMVKTWASNGSVGSLSGSMVSLLGPENWATLQSNFETAMADSAISDAAQSAAGEAAAAGAAEALSTAITVAGWVYFAYQMYNLYTQMKKCTAGEYILSCKIAKGVCHYVGSRCKVKVAGSCLQRMPVYCCFNSVLARIINEQGRPQIDRGWGTAKSPECRGFRADEFARIDLSAVDFGEYADDLIRELNPNVQEKYKKAVESLGDSFAPE